MKKISVIVAIAKNFAIGKDNELLWHLPEDLKRFRKITSGHQVIMGKKTYESLPVRPLKNRTNIVITDDPEDEFQGCITVHSIDEALKYCNEREESFIIGGGSVYRQFLPHATRLYITYVDKEFEADTFFPEIDFEEWKLVEKEEHFSESPNDFSYTFLIYEK